MADNVPITPGSGRDIATDDVGSVHYQKIKIALGADGAVDTLLDAGQQLSADSVPVVLASDHPDIKITLDGEQVVISGTVQVQSNSANLATEATAAAIQTAVELIDNAISGSEMQVDLVGGGPIGTTTDAEAAADGTVIAILKRLRTLIGDIFSTVGNIYTSLGVLTMGDNSAYTATMDRVFAVGGYMDDASPNTLSEGNIGTFRVTTNRAVHVNLRDASGNELTPGGTQYTEDAGAAANPTGTALIMVRDDSRVGSITNADGDNIAVRGNNKGEMYVKDTDAETVLNGILTSLGYIQPDTTLIATETGNAATSLAIMDDWDESDRAKVNLIQNEAGITGGQGPVESNTPRVTLASNDEHLTTVNESLSDISTNTYNTATSVGVMDDWDESDRAKVNIIAGQAGVSAGAGAVAVNTPRVTLASDDPAVAELQVVNAYLDSLAGGQMPAYIEDAPAVANPNGGAIALVRDDSRGGGLTTANGDIVMARGNNKGEQYVKDTDAAALLTTIDTDTGAIASTIDALAGALASVATDALTANIITGETGVAGGTGNAGANTIRVVSAADDPAVATLDNIYLSLGAGAGTDLAAIVATTGNQVVSLGIMDDWDEADRAKVNIVAGQAGVTAGAGAVAANTPRVTLASDDPAVVALQALDNAISGSEMQVDIVTVPAPLSTAGGGTEATALRVTIASDSTGVLSVDDNGGSLTVDGTVTASNVTGNVAHDAADSGNPIKTGGVAYNFDGSAPGTAVVEGDRANHITDVYGRPFVETTHPNYWTASADYASAQTNASIKAAPGAGLKLYITDVIISNGATAGNVTLLDGSSGGTVKLEIYPGVNGGLAHPFRTPIALTANTALCITSTTVTTHSVTICGYTAP